MYVLAIDTSSPDGSIALTKDGEITRLSGDRKNHYSQRLYAWLEKLKIEQKANFSELDGVVVCRGPGTFTGLRIGLATAKGLAIAAECPIIAFDTLETVAVAEVEKNDLVRPVLNAGRCEIYTALFRRNTQGRPTRIEDNSLIRPEDLHKLPLENVLLSGSGISLLKNPDLLDKKGATIDKQFNPLAPALIELVINTDALARAKPGEYPKLNYIRAAVS